MLPHLSDFVLKILECGLLFAACKRNYVFSQKNFLVTKITFCLEVQIGSTKYHFVNTLNLYGKRVNPFCRRQMKIKS